MINIQDYKSYFHQNFNFIELLRENKSLVYDRLEDVFKVLGFIEMMVDDNKNVEEDFEVIFEAGFSYLHEQLEEIKIIFNTYFKKDFHKFLEYESIINYDLYLNDLTDILKEKSMYTNELKKTIDEISEDIETILKDHRIINQEVFDKYNSELECKVPVGILTTLEIFGMIVEELAI